MAEVLSTSRALTHAVYGLIGLAALTLALVGFVACRIGPLRLRRSSPPIGSAPPTAPRTPTYGFDKVDKLGSSHKKSRSAIDVIRSSLTPGHAPPGEIHPLSPEARQRALSQFDYDYNGLNEESAISVSGIGRNISYGDRSISYGDRSTKEPSSEPMESIRERATTHESVHLETTGRI